LFFIVGALAGFQVGLLLYTAILALIGKGPYWLMIVFGIACAVAGAFFAKTHEEFIQ